MKLGVYGLGRFGAFWAARLADYTDVVAFSRSPKSDIDPRIGLVSEDELADCDAVVLCVAISAMEDVVSRIADRIKPGTLVMDTCSVKVYPVSVMQSSLPETVQILGTHPMFGPDSGRNGIDGLPLVYSPVRISFAADSFYRDLFRKMGLHLVEMTPDDHDKTAAYTQGITHFLGRVLQDLHLEPSPIATLGYSKLLEIIEQTCNDPEQLFLDLQRYNPHTHEMRESLKYSLDRFMTKLKEVTGLPA
ncbi:prephenate dehydrogenase/arogenate dehydrogenase family protein [Marispirochaeta sp.]|jgi:prephenate dehydrogenase|uniref:prephenate dehydrogenase/arogenate dehydrogenase family protein n=1 Tax=Marispirochaeta sp. TaxID=2038653 RepID=UPI0029C8719A|nr:prephenate dehydrogenase/arogenate dehydrogenase family protein [Marispirochaeta sp.]